MVVTTNYVPMSDECKITLINAISSGNKVDIRDFMRSNDLETYNCVPFIKWDYINTNVIRRLRGKGYQALKVKRGGWTLVFIYDEETRYLYSLVRDTRLEDIINEDERRKRQHTAKPHYLDALVSLNIGLRADVNYVRTTQLEFFPPDAESWNSATIELLSQMLGALYGAVEKHVMISFTTVNGDLTAVDAYLFTNELEIAYKENWNEYIQADFGKVLDESGHTNNKSEDEDEEEIRLNLRKKVKVDSDDDNN